MSQTHCLSPKAGRTGFHISPYLQEIGCFLGQSLPFDESSEVLNKLTGCSMSDKQIERLSHHYGEELEKRTLDEVPFEAKTTLHYAMADGSMVFTREDKWREMKLGRVFAASDLLTFKKRKEVKESHYTAHLGTCSAFFEKFERHLDGCKNLVAIGDGAPWIWDYFDSAHPDAVQILDFFHAAERLSGFAKNQFEDPDQRKAWLGEQQSRLLENQVKEVIQTISDLKCKGEAANAQKQTITYFTNNQHRMAYKTWKDKGWLIGSGPIESAHRNVIQQRLKLSGQRWTLKGVQQVANLRVAYKSNDWNQVIGLIKMAA